MSKLECRAQQLDDLRRADQIGMRRPGAQRGRKSGYAHGRSSCRSEVVGSTSCPFVQDIFRPHVRQPFPSFRVLDPFDCALQPAVVYASSCGLAPVVLVIVIEDRSWYRRSLMLQSPLPSWSFWTCLHSPS